MSEFYAHPQTFCLGMKAGWIFLYKTLEFSPMNADKNELSARFKCFHLPVKPSHSLELDSLFVVTSLSPHWWHIVGWKQLLRANSRSRTAFWKQKLGLGKVLIFGILSTKMDVNESLNQWINDCSMEEDEIDRCWIDHQSMHFAFQWDGWWHGTRTLYSICGCVPSSAFPLHRCY